MEGSAAFQGIQGRVLLSPGTIGRRTYPEPAASVEIPFQSLTIGGQVAKNSKGSVSTLGE